VVLERIPGRIAGLVFGGERDLVQGLDPVSRHD
jgi:hypothetical protein